MKNYYPKIGGRLKISALLLLSLIILVTLSAPRVAASDSLLIQTNSDSYNIGETVYVAVAGTPGITVLVTLFDASNATITQRPVQITANDSSLFMAIYSLNVTDKPGTWRATTFDPSSNETAETTFEVVPIWSSIQALDNRISDLQNQIFAQNDTIIALQGSIESLSPRQSSAEFSSYIPYLATAISILALILGITAMRRKTGFVPKKRGR